MAVQIDGDIAGEQRLGFGLLRPGRGGGAAGGGERGGGRLQRLAAGELPPLGRFVREPRRPLPHRFAQARTPHEVLLCQRELKRQRRNVHPLDGAVLPSAIRVAPSASKLKTFRTPWRAVSSIITSVSVTKTSSRSSAAWRARRIWAPPSQAR